uniref:Large ribosomal subunit protein bL12 n=1 Tax=candidate division WOR-3 bacterium TaxID=2052148 RepID=A0A7C4Y5M2_UNCW3
MTEGKITQIVEMISSLTVLELKELVDVLKEKFGVQSIPVAGIPQGAAVQQQAAPQAEEKTEYEVILTSFGNSKLNVIKEVRTITGLGLKEAKELVEGVPKPLKSGVTKEEANKIKEIIEKAGGSVEIK